ncbi:hypothetical protein DL764_009971 [Monosporascus ibericus]|uniref:Uncharacterized protein n=1 Tax=Monosporascus ibericus TaxID=155417 RepID=A0A4Q4SWE8_9PEZI|nr:hypothetical protein DL764_009971 [Monosporascus ibericus]
MSTYSNMAFYPMLPNELKRKILESAIDDPAIHHFKILLPDAGDAPKMSIEPITGADSSKGSAQKDPSPWRDYWNLSAANHLSRLVIGPMENRLTLWMTDKEKLVQLKRKAQHQTFKGADGPLRYGERATIDAARDLVRFKFIGNDLDTGSLSNDDNRHLLRGIRRVAFDWSNDAGTGKSNWLLHPFDCVGDGHSHASQSHCHYNLCKFLALFEDLETFYFVVKVIKGEVNMRWLTEYEKELSWVDEPGATDLGIPTRRKKAPQIIQESMAFFREAAEANDLEVFRDKKRTYYEVREEDTARLKLHISLWEILEKLEDRWKARLLVRTRQNANGLTAKRVQQPKFKALVYAV